MYRYFIRFSFRGTSFHGWQIQENAYTVQALLNKSLSTLTAEDVYCIGAGRTDAGVHAKDFYAHFDLENEIVDFGNFIYKLNCLNGNEVYVSEVFRVKPEAHSRFSAKSRTYQYHILRERDPFLNDYAYFYYGNLNIDEMNSAAEVLYSYSDFTSFSKADTQTKTNICKIISANWILQDKELIFTIKADRFLRNMVRAIAGTLLDIGKGKLTISDFKSIIESKNRCLAGESLPANALFLVNVEYNLEDVLF